MNSFKEKIQKMLQDNCLIEYPVTVYMNHLIVHLPELNFTQTTENLETRILSCADTYFDHREEDLLIELQCAVRQHSFKLRKS